MFVLRARQPVAVAVFIASLSLVLTACGSGDNEESSTPVPPTSSSQPSPTPTPEPVYGPDLLSDGSFESGNLDVWEPRKNDRQVVELSADEARTGEYSLHMTTPAEEEDWPWVVLQEVFDVEVGKQYHFQGYSLQAMSGPLQVLFDFYDDQGEFLDRILHNESVDSGDEWLESAYTVEAPEGATVGRLILQLRIRPPEESGTATDGMLELFVDDVSVREVIE